MTRLVRALERVHWPSGRQLLASCVFLAREVVTLRARIDALEGDLRCLTRAWTRATLTSGGSLRFQSLRPPRDADAAGRTPLRCRLLLRRLRTVAAGRLPRRRTTTPDVMTAQPTPRRRPVSVVARVELCWGCQNVLGPVYVHARPPHARVTGSGWQRWHPTCVPGICKPGDYETAEPRPTDDPDSPCCGLHVYSIVPWGACCDPNDCGPCCERCPTCPTLLRADAG